MSSFFKPRLEALEERDVPASFGWSHMMQVVYPPTDPTEPLPPPPPPPPPPVGGVIVVVLPPAPPWVPGS